jgi:hypothetical protein
MNKAGRSAVILGLVSGLVLGIGFSVMLIRNESGATVQRAAPAAPALPAPAAPAAPAQASAARAALPATPQEPEAEQERARDEVPQVPSAVAPPPAREASRSRPRPAATEAAPARSAATARISIDAPELHERMKPVMARGTRMHLAVEGFDDPEEFATMAYAARNTGVPFVLLKHRVLTEGQSLADAIRLSKPDVDARAEVARARRAARSDLAGF